MTRPSIMKTRLSGVREYTSVCRRLERDRAHRVCTGLRANRDRIHPLTRSEEELGYPFWSRPGGAVNRHAVKRHAIDPELDEECGADVGDAPELQLPMVFPSRMCDRVGALRLASAEGDVLAGNFVERDQEIIGSDSGFRHDSRVQGLQ
jgi:ADP-ribose pyrophosphatase YjhB (NUDIX family)